jgi:hypothetical protein
MTAVCSCAFNCSDVQQLSVCQEALSTKSRAKLPDERLVLYVESSLVNKFRRSPSEMHGSNPFTRTRTLTSCELITSRVSMHYSKPQSDASRHVDCSANSETARLRHCWNSGLLSSDQPQARLLRPMKATRHRLRDIQGVAKTLFFVVDQTTEYEFKDGIILRKRTHKTFA